VRLIPEGDTELIMVVSTFDLCPHTLTTLRADEIALDELQLPGGAVPLDLR